MKSVVVETRVKRELNYPCLMKSMSGIIVLFIDKHTGIVVSNEGDDDNNIGDYRTNWVESSFVLFEGSITLSND